MCDCTGGGPKQSGVYHTYCQCTLFLSYILCLCMCLLATTSNAFDITTHAGCRKQVWTFSSLKRLSGDPLVLNL